MLELPAEVAAFSMKHHFTIERITERPALFTQTWILAEGFSSEQ